MSQSGGDDDESGLAAGKSINGVPTVNRLYDGIPQDGATLGNPDAPATMVEFVDLQCPFCAEYTRDALPTIVKRYVRTGKLKVELRPVAILGPDSATGAAAAAAAAQRTASGSSPTSGTSTRDARTAATWMTPSCAASPAAPA